ncbi:MAG: DUF2868 domain-containing protein [Casimicrobiaceae bacterium]
MDERTALDVLAVRALETTEQGREAWSDADRAWASRAAAEVVGEHGTPDQFLGRRAALVLERVGERDGRFVRGARALTWRPWVGNAVIVGALALGIAVDRIGGAQTINLLAPPVFLLLVWNLAMYAALALVPLVRRGQPPGALRATLARFASGSGAVPRVRGAERYRMTATEWAHAATPLYAARAARILHFAAAALALGVIAGMYVRGLAFEYRAAWESTFLDAAQVRALLAGALAPGSWLTGIAVPDVAQVASIRAPAGENAATWLHLFAATVVAVIVVPRLALGVAAAILERRRATRVPLPLRDAYFQRLLRGFRGGAARVRVVPYSYSPAAPALAGLEAIVARAFGGGAALVVEAPVAYGGAALAERAVPGHLIALFNATATPERDVHGAFVGTLAAGEKTLPPVIALVDETAFRARAAGDDARLVGRRATWRDALAADGVAIVFSDLAAPDLAAAETALDAALAGGR